MDTILKILIVVFGFLGFLLSAYIYFKKRKAEPIACPLGFECHSVIASPYSRFLGIPVELIGMFYYGATAIGWLIYFLFPSLISPIFVFVLLLMATGAYTFSLYLTFIQIFAIKSGCSWCLASALLSIGIFVIEGFVVDINIVSILINYHNLFVASHVLGVIIGFGAAVVADILFFKFLKDFKISQFEADTLHTISQIIWFALGIIILTGIGLYLPEADELNQSAKFLVKMIVVAVIIINGGLLNLLVAPKLVQISFGKDWNGGDPKLLFTRKLAFGLGAISSTSWFTAFALGITLRAEVSFLTLLSIYILILIMAIAGSQILERVFSRHK